VVSGRAVIAEGQQSIHQALSFIGVFLLVFAFVALFTGSFVIFNTFSIIVAQRLRELALLRAVGGSRRQVMTSVLGESRSSECWPRRPASGRGSAWPCC
jgi:ABC-type antimicrobial peptide transport system permease subunit